MVASLNPKKWTAVVCSPTSCSQFCVWVNCRGQICCAEQYVKQQQSISSPSSPALLCLEQQWATLSQCSLNWPVEPRYDFWIIFMLFFFFFFSPYLGSTCLHLAGWPINPPLLTVSDWMCQICWYKPIRLPTKTVGGSSDQLTGVSLFTKSSSKEPGSISLSQPSLPTALRLLCVGRLQRSHL